ncbi:unnamed protein product [Ceutorhynchus assimilis]|uniref:Major facilitator superfamily (MFS) profile domain-containing protein n=1 Tax=Ceutorhynchus assimilis TaxID=467358 RepID=A0A9N9QSA2_9CUCU|nr:unnamed protein product [Ceutorhynchus assimilis]
MKLPSFPDSFFTYFSAVAVNLLTYGGGMAYGWSSPALPKLNGQVDPEHNPLSQPITVREESWIASLLSLGAMISPLLAEFISEKIGRKKTLLALSLPMIIGHFIMIFANNVLHFYIARFLMGLTEGCIFSIIPVYSAEISEKHNRGTIGAIMLLFISIGHFSSSTIGPYVSLQNFGIISLVPCLLFLIIFGIFVPETPYFYVLVDKTDYARKCLKKLRRKDDIDEEMEEIIKGVKELKGTQDKNPYKELFTDKHSVRAFLIALNLMVLQQFTGLIYIVDYTQKIFDSAQTPLNGDISVILVTTIQVFSIASSTNTIDRVNRKVLLIISLIIIFLLQIILGAFFYLQQNNVDLKQVSWLPIACLMIFIMAFQLGIGPISYIFPGEILEPNVKSLGNTLVMSLGLLAEFGIATLFPLMSDQIGFYVPFWIFALTSFVAVFFVWFCVPETRGKSFLQIQNDVRNKEK